VEKVRLPTTTSWHPICNTTADTCLPDGALGDHEVVAFLLALVTGSPAAAEQMLSALIAAPPKTSADIE
jgi:hypothetical protein